MTTKLKVKAHHARSVVYTFGEDCCQCDEDGVFFFDYDDASQPHRELIAHWRTLGFDIEEGEEVKQAAPDLAKAVSMKQQAN